jgi:hypothetical protein
LRLQPPAKETELGQGRQHRLDQKKSGDAGSNAKNVISEVPTKGCAQRFAAWYGN